MVSGVINSHRKSECWINEKSMIEVRLEKETHLKDNYEYSETNPSFQDN